MHAGPWRCLPTQLPLHAPCRATEAPRRWRERAWAWASRSRSGLAWAWATPGAPWSPEGWWGRTSGSVSVWDRSLGVCGGLGAGCVSKTMDDGLTPSRMLGNPIKPPEICPSINHTENTWADVIVGPIALGDFAWGRGLGEQWRTGGRRASSAAARSSQAPPGSFTRRNSPVLSCRVEHQSGAMAGKGRGQA